MVTKKFIGWSKGTNIHRIDVTIEKGPNGGNMVRGLPEKVTNASNTLGWSAALGYHFSADVDGRRLVFSMIKGKVTEHKCNHKCMNSKSHICECSCGGANHGKNWD